MKKNIYLLVLVFLSVVAVSGCGGEGGGGGGGGTGGGTPGYSVLLATGGTGFTGAGGKGGRFLIETTGWVEVLASGTVDATFVVSAITPSFGPNAVVLSAGTTTVQTKNGYLYQRDENGNNTVVTGLTVPAGATLVLVDEKPATGYGTLKLSNDLLINGTITTDASTGLSIDANLIKVESSGKISTSAAVPGTSAKEIHLGSGQNMTKQVVNRGTIEAKGVDSGNGGSIFMNADDLVVHQGTIDTSGGSSASGKGGNSGTLDVLVNYGNFYSSGTVLANGGDGTDGNGGSGGTITLETDAMGAVVLNGTVSAKGGSSFRSTPAGIPYSGGTGGSLSIASYNSSNSNVTSPGKIQVAGLLDVRGGDGELNGGSGGSIEIRSQGSNAAHKGIDVEFLGFPRVILNGGIGATKGGDGLSQALSIQSFPPQEDELISDLVPTVRGKTIVNEAAIEARGGDAAGTGGLGGTVELQGSMSNKPAKSWRPANQTKKWITGIGNGGTIDVSGGNGEIGGSASSAKNGAVYFVADYVLNSGNFKARGGNGTKAGGNGGNIFLFSYVPPTFNKGAADLAGGTGGNTSSGTFFVDGKPI